MILTLLTDFGLSDHYVAAMKGVILTIRPDVQLVDISHEITPYAVFEASYTLAQTWRCFPSGTIHLVVVDPGVGSARRPLLAEAEGHYFVAPDNGVLSLALAGVPAVVVRHITARRFFREPISHTFHGRDLFAPVAGHLSRGIPASAFGAPVTDFVRLPLTLHAESGAGQWSGVVLKVDRFGNIITSFGSDVFALVLQGSFELVVEGQPVTRLSRSYDADHSGGLFVITGSSGFLEVSLKERSAAQFTGASAGAEVILRSKS